ncbi:type VI secretion system contractile sheath small subunit [Myxococcus sp. K38C18041901]|uniref:type VI secretion system contractile sheath small subunit n=1 Tax=Myxococcus guangdongensis TaxID=2906760 RepID=UPI0020A7D021|nr:type VI secretion system contractile sheath small subunit [Myxococcus guangdongensis]MCP3065280.1 type VI secretion system contractile sheath small subunit [Myxococcus guangdongensis]
MAPKERVNIVYKSETGNAQSEVELPLKVLVVGDYTGRQDERPVEERAPINIDKGNFNEVMAKQGLALDVSVPNKLSNEPDASMSVSLKFQTLADFTPEGIVNQVPELHQLLQLRAALNALKGPLGNVPAFRKKIQMLLGDTEGRQRLMAELGLDKKSE